MPMNRRQQMDLFEFFFFRNFFFSLSGAHQHKHKHTLQPRMSLLYLHWNLFIFFQKTRRINRKKMKRNEKKKSKRTREKNIFWFRCLFPILFFSTSFRRLSLVDERVCLCVCVYMPRHCVLFVKYKRPKTTAVLWPQQRADKILRS